MKKIIVAMIVLCALRGDPRSSAADDGQHPRTDHSTTRRRQFQASP